MLVNLQFHMPMAACITAHSQSNSFQFRPSPAREDMRLPLPRTEKRAGLLLTLTLVRTTCAICSLIIYLQTPIAADHAQVRLAHRTLATTSPQSQTVSPRRETSPVSTTHTLNNSERARRNRKAQCAFRERRDGHVLTPLHGPYKSLDWPQLYLRLFTNPFFLRQIKYLATRSEVFDAALQQAEESIRRW